MAIQLFTAISYGIIMIAACNVLYAIRLTIEIFILKTNMTKGIFMHKTGILMVLHVH